ncbi:hypothetical protein [Mesorhizobium sp. M4B.F.Ca.ET.017.02.2.1]|uniref:hypothetical protein n=1 Tax=Mesorhizobium sp. M4B.F.Ca.ET.017.02.2.1 TaxID=2496649 RepID=UPI000FCA6640|nr:hypothetical protein [Mesorhizobium sp. M4B.F.Ca.ET.017.02.2.1]RVD30526.1 hypothetical protein EN738_05705 [Mesorhizobium sp. M4B.F.Ca.ET.017.02.2.1]
MVTKPLELIADGRAALEYSTLTEPGTTTPIMWLCRPSGERLELMHGREAAEARAAALIDKGAL